MGKTKPMSNGIPRLVPGKQLAQWQMQDGTLIRICEMEDSHLINSIRLIRRRAAERFQLMICKLNIEIDKLTECEATTDLLNEIAELKAIGPEVVLPHIYYVMELDFERRHLDWELIASMDTQLMYDCKPKWVDSEVINESC